MTQYKVVLEQGPEGQWTLTVPALPGYIACGDSEDEVLALARQGIPFHLSCLAEEGQEAPQGPGNARIATLTVAA